MDTNPIQKVRQELYTRLAFLDFTEEMLRDKSLFQLVTPRYLLVGHLKYVGTYTCTCRALHDLFGDEFYYRDEKSENRVAEENEPKPKMVVN
jgi:hypothetical protein